MDDLADDIERARQVADEQWARSTELFSDLVDAARGTLREHSPVDTWAKLTVVTAEQLDCTTPRQQHAVKMAVTAALLLAQQTEHMDL